MSAGLILRLKRGRDHLRVHPWVFKGDVADVDDAAPGSAVTVLDATSRFVGRGFYNPGCALCCRILTRRDEPVDGALFHRRLAAALALRTSQRARAVDRSASGRPGAERREARRLVWSEADLLPGLVVDQYGDVLVVQCHTLGMAAVRPLVVTQLRALLGERPVFDADDSAAAAIEGFAPARGWFDGEGPDAVVVDEGAIQLTVTLGRGQKTGLYLDQAQNRQRVVSLARDRDVLDAFSYTGGFACHALAAGARRAVCLESSPEAIAGARENFARNRVAAGAEIRAVNAFDELRRLGRDGARFDLVILDPPPFARSRGALEGAGRGYKEVNLRAMRLLAPGGHLLTFSCSHHVSPALFEDICRGAASDARVPMRVLERLAQAPDHPVLLTVPETRYLSGLLLEALDRE